MWIQEQTKTFFSDRIRKLVDYYKKGCETVGRNTEKKFNCYAYFTLFGVNEMILLLCFDLPMYGLCENNTKKPGAWKKLRLTVRLHGLAQTYEATKITASLFKSLGFCKLLSGYFKIRLTFI